MNGNQQPRRPVVLVVDDEAILRMLASDYFEDAGFEVLAASNGAEALALLRDRPDIRAVMTDVQMPGDPDGLKLARTFRDACPDCAIVVVSGRIQPGPDALASGAQFIPKPYDGARVVEAVQRLLDA